MQRSPEFGARQLRPHGSASRIGSRPHLAGSLDNSKSSADRLLRSIDDIRELVSPETPTADLAEEFDITLCLGETIELLNLASGDRASRLILQAPATPLMGRQHRRALEQALDQSAGCGFQAEPER